MSSNFWIFILPSFFTAARFSIFFSQIKMAELHWMFFAAFLLGFSKALNCKIFSVWGCHQHTFSLLKAKIDFVVKKPCEVGFLFRGYFWLSIKNLCQKCSRDRDRAIETKFPAEFCYAIFFLVHMGYATDD